MKTKAPSEKTKHTIPAVIHAMDLLRLLGEGHGETTTKALALRLGIPRTSCYRLLRSLVERDWVRPATGGRHELSLGLLPLFSVLRSATALAAAVEPALQMLAMRSELTAKVSVRQGDCAVTVARVESPRQTSVAVRLGASFPLAYGSSGTVLLSDLPREELDRVLADSPEECWEHQRLDDVFKRLKELREQGWCADLGTYRLSCHAVSAPLRDAREQIAAVMTIIGFPSEISGNRTETLAAILLEGARQAEKAMRNQGIFHGVQPEGKP